ncbi:MAG TPA: hypothetical protein VFU13_01080 [Steroidobacteraceae bacterium]|nr:hypothetical protein [Steroidobacteraceae bacterium]
MIRKLTGALVFTAALAALILWFTRPHRDVPLPEASDRSNSGMPAESRTTASASSPEMNPAARISAAAGTRQIDADKLAAALASPDEATRNDAIENLFADFLARDPAAGRRFLETVDNAQQRVRLLHVLGAGLAKTDPDGALAWAEGLPDAVERDAAMSVVLTQISLTDPGKAVALRHESQPSADDALLENLTQRWAERDLTSALQWADSLPPGEQRDRANSRAAFVQAQTSPETAAQLIVDRMSSGPAREEALISVLHQWALKDFTAAARWTEDLPPGPMKVRAVAEMNVVSQLNSAPER